MTLSLQLLIISILPLSFLVMALYTWRSKTRRRYVYVPWLITLLLGAIWASSTVRLYTTFDRTIRFSWGIVGSYAFTLTIITLLLTTFRQIRVSKTEARLSIALSLLLGVGAFFLDLRLWRHFPEGIVLGGQLIQQFFLWSGVWVASWVTPLLGAIILTQRASVGLSRSLFRNLLNYWKLMLLLFLLGGIFNSINQINQPAWQQIGVLISIVATFVGSYTITHSQLPDLPLAIRHLISRLSGTILIFVMALGSLTFLVRFIANLNAEQPTVNPILIFGLAAGFFALIFTVSYRVINDITRRIFLPAAARRQIVLSEYANAIGNLPEPEQLARLALRIVQSTFGTNDAWFFETSDGPAGRLILKPLAGLQENLPQQPVALIAKSPIANYLRRRNMPLVQYDIDTLEHFADISTDVKRMLTEWQRILFMPLHAGDSLIGVLALGEKRSGESYNKIDYVNLGHFSEQMSPLFAQAQNLASLQQINNFVFKENQILSREKRHLTELVKLYRQFVSLISPELIRPISNVGQLTRQLEGPPEGVDIKPAMVSDLGNQLDGLKRKLDNLIALSNRIDSRKPISFGAVNFNELLDTAVHQLEKMASARRVKIEMDLDPTLPAVLGDYEQLLEGVRHLLHNAIKFNKIGGVVQLSTAVENGELLFKVVDTGVGIPEDRLDTLWQGLATASNNGTSRGNGLGLPLANFIISSHGGEIKVQSKYGSGSVFALTLPLLDEE